MHPSSGSQESAVQALWSLHAIFEIGTPAHDPSPSQRSPLVHRLSSLHVVPEGAGG